MNTSVTLQRFITARHIVSTNLYNAKPSYIQKFQNPTCAKEFVFFNTPKKYKPAHRGTFQFSQSLYLGPRLVLVNAIYFKANWLTRFNETDTKPMTFEIGRKKNTRVVILGFLKSFGL